MRRNYNNNNPNRQKRKLTRGKRKSNRGYEAYIDPQPLMLSTELKYVDTTVASSAVPNTGVWLKVTLPPQGTTSVTRVADRAHIVRLEILGWLYANVNFEITRFIVIQTKGLFTSAPSVTDVLATASPTSHYAYNARELYEVLHDESIDQVPGGDSGSHKFRLSIKPRIPEMRFVPGSSNVYNGQLYVLFINAGSNSTQQMNYRLWFEDSN